MLKRDSDQKMYPEIHLKPPDKPEWYRISGRSRHPSGSRYNFVEITPKHARRGAIKHPKEILGIPLKQKALPGNFTPGLGKPGRVARGNRTSSYINILRGNYQATNHILFSDCKKKKTFIQIIKNGPFSNLRRHGTASSHWSCYQEGYETVQQTASVLDRWRKDREKRVL